MSEQDDLMWSTKKMRARHSERIYAIVGTLENVKNEKIKQLKTQQESIDIKFADSTVKCKTPVNIAEIIEQVLALKHEESLMVSDERAAGRYDAVGDVIEILERYR